MGLLDLWNAVDDLQKARDIYEDTKATAEAVAGNAFICRDFVADGKKLHDNLDEKTKEENPSSLHLLLEVGRFLTKDRT